MLLDRIDIDSHGPLSRLSLGPFSPTLNAIVASSGAGKTALVRFLRDSLTGTTPAREGLANSSGRIVWSAADGFYHCRRTPNGSPQGHRFVNFEARLQDTASAHRFARESVVVDLPASIVDGVVTDTVMTSVQHCVHAAVTAGLDHSAVAFDSTRETQVHELRREIAELEAQIRSHSIHSRHASARPHQAYDSCGLTLDMKRLRDRRAELALEVSAIDARRDWAAKADAELSRRRRKRQLFAEIANEIEQLRRRESDLKLRLAEVESQLQQMDDETTRAATRESIARAYRQRLQEIDTQWVRVQKVVREIRALGQRWFGKGRFESYSDWLDQTIDRVQRFDNGHSLNLDRVDDHRDLQGHHDLQADLYGVDRDWNQSFDTIRAEIERPEGVEALNGVDVQRRIDAICRLVDNLVGRCEEQHADSISPYRTHDRETSNTKSRLTDWDAWAEAELDRHEHRRHGSTEHLSSVDPVDRHEAFEPTSSLDRAERLLDEERNYRADALAHSNENVAWIAGVLNGVSQRLRGLAGLHAAYGSSNLDPLFNPRRDEASFTDPANDGADLDPQAKVAAVRRCEQETLEVLRRLSSRREVMLRRIAELQNRPMSQVAASFGDAQACHDDPQLYQWLVRDRLIADDQDAKRREDSRKRLQQQKTDTATDLKRTIDRVTDRMAEAETIRMYLRSLPVVHRYDDDDQLRARLVAEIRAIDEQLSRPRVHPSLLERHAQCVTRLQSLLSQGPTVTGLAAAASEHLRRLTAGRMNSVCWARTSPTTPISMITIDGRSESACSATERFIAALAIRLAAADELAKRGRALPLIVETPSLRHLVNENSSDHLRSLLQTAVEALAESTRRGRQIVVLTDDAVIADAIMRVGGAVHSLSGIARAHHRTAVDSGATLRTFAPTERMYDVNRDFDLAWREASDDDAAWRFDERRTTEPAPDHQPVTTNQAFVQPVRSRFDLPAVPGNGHTTWEDNASTVRHTVAHGRLEAADVPFYLTGHSPIEHAPSVSAGEAQRLRTIGVSRIEHLLGANPKELAGSLALDGVDASTVRRWQNECRLVCGVRKLHPFDARVLAGAGFALPRELTEIEPSQVVDRVEAFLATDRGQRVLSSGTIEDVSRLRRWIQRGRQSDHARASVSNTHTVAAPVNERRSDREHDSSMRSNRRERVAAVRSREVERSERTPSIRRDDRSQRVERAERMIESSGRVERSERREREPRHASREVAPLRFFLQRSSDVEDAPSIGPRMAERLYAIGVRTIDDLLSRSAASIADALQHAKVDAGVVHAWQQQSALVCRVPMLRGHDAQLLVAAGITEPERLAECDAQRLLKQIEPIANSREGKSILRGGKHPDLAEMQEWIQNAQQHRELVAA